MLIDTRITKNGQNGQFVDTKQYTFRDLNDFS